VTSDRERCLFSAPFDFLPDATLAAYREMMDVEFGEIWLPEELKTRSDITVWVPNPGQNFTVDDAILDRLPSLKVISTPSTGRNHINEPMCRERGVAVFSLQDDRPTLDSIAASSEWTFLLLLNALRRLDFAVNEVTEGRWRTREDMLRGTELSGLQIGIVGFGRNGSRMARYCAAFDATSATYDPYLEDPGVPRWTLERIFADSDAVVVCCALTPETTGMIGADLLRTMKRDAVFVNTSRGEVVVEQELADVIRERPDLRVAVDVVVGEVTNTHDESPLLPLHREGKMIVSPHIAGATVESQSKAAIGALNALTRFFRADVD
jgi:phosphoglycerate dehydrogenase-like enzyme